VPTTSRLVVYAAGGGMRGVFGAGALHALAEMGALAVLRGEEAVDVPEVLRVLATEHLIDTERLVRSPLPVCFGVVDRAQLSFRWLDARRPDAIRVLLASSTVFPFVHDAVAIDGVPCIDGGYREAVGYRRLRREHPEAKLLLVLNGRDDESILRRMAVAAVLRRHDDRLARAWVDTTRAAAAELEEAQAASHTLVLTPENGFPVHFTTTDTAALAHGYWLGYRSVLTRRDRLRDFLAP
jgi:predicted patatin/cPLA2 family phospholipase